MSTTRDPTGSCFLNRFASLPIVRATCDLYNQSKEQHELLGKGLNVLEYGVSRATPTVGNLVAKVPGSSALDLMACGYLEKLETKWSALQEPPQELLKNVRSTATEAVSSGVRRAMQTYPGRTVVRSLDTMINWSETTLEGFQPTPEQCKDGEENTETQKPSVVELPTKVTKVIVTTPLEAYVTLLRLVRKLLATVAGLNIQGSTPPRSRGKPDRKAPSDDQGILKRAKSTVQSYLGFGAKEEELTTASPAPRGGDSVTECSEEDSTRDTITLEEASRIVGAEQDNDPDFMGRESTESVPEQPKVPAPMLPTNPDFYRRTPFKTPTVSTTQRVFEPSGMS